jgi:hypothetical protein
MYESDFMVQPYERFKSRPVSEYAQWLENDWHYTHSGLQFPEKAHSFEEVVTAWFQQREEQTGLSTIGATIQHRFDLLPALFPQARYVHLLRDGRPVAASAMNMGWVGNLYAGGLRWRRKIDEVFALQQKIPRDRWLEVKYEELLRNPVVRLTEICTFLGLEYDDAMLRYHQRSTYDVPDAANADRWRTRLSPREIYMAEIGAGETLVRAGYQRMFPPAQLGLFERFAVWLDHRRRRAAFNFNRYGAYVMIARKLWRLFGVRRPSLERRYRSIRDAHVK